MHSLQGVHTKKYDLFRCVETILTELPEGLFRDLLQQEEDDWWNDIDTVDLADNRIVTLSRGVFQAGSSGESTVIGDLHLEGNCLTMLPPGVFHGLKFGDNSILDMSQNKLKVLHADAFHGLTFSYDGILGHVAEQVAGIACRRLSWSQIW